MTAPNPLTMSRDEFDEYWESLSDGERIVATQALKAVLAERLIEQQYRPRDWYCDRPDCDGSPHDGRLNHARAAQRIPEDLPRAVYWRGGRGSGKTKAATMAFASLIVDNFDEAREWAVVAPTAGDARTVCMESVTSGLLTALGAKVGAGGTVIEPGPYVDRYSKTTATIYLANGGIVYSDGADDGAYRIQGKNLAGAMCLAAGELVITARGDVPIEDVRPSDLVMTRTGWKAVQRVICTSPAAPLIAVTMADGRTLRCTPDHLVHTDRGWVQSRMLQVGAKVTIWNDPWQDRLRGTISRVGATTDVATGTTQAAPITKMADQSDSISRSGKVRTDKPSRPVWLSTTSTTTTRTMIRPISRLLRRWSTWRTTTAARSGLSKPGISLASESLSRGSDARLPDTPVFSAASSSRGSALGTRSSAPDSARSECDTAGTRNCVAVIDAERPICQLIESTDSVAGRVVTLTSVIAVRPAGVSDVYDLTIEDAHEFFASGVLVHNCDEVGLWKNWKVAWNESLRYAVRISPAKLIICGTPKRTMPARELVKQLLADDVSLGGRTVNRQLLTRDNAANLDEDTLREFLSSMGTALERQELEGEIIDDIEGAMWRIENIDANRLEVESAVDAFDVINPLRVGIGIDPAVTSNKDSDETGIIVAAKGADGRGFVLEDLSGTYRPEDWPPVVMEAAERWQADRIVAEVNNGGDYIGSVLRAAGYKGAYDTVRATRGKAVRAEPVAMAYQKGRGVHVGRFPELEEQLCGWVPGEGDSPDRLDALVWIMTYLGVVQAAGWGSLYAPPEKVDVGAPEKPTSRSSWGNVYRRDQQKPA